VGGEDHKGTAAQKGRGRAKKIPPKRDSLQLVSEKSK
jgi:hypothetical protein